jgi:hypothetical protein
MRLTDAAWVEPRGQVRALQTGDAALPATTLEVAVAPSKDYQKSDGNDRFFWSRGRRS